MSQVVDVLADEIAASGHVKSSHWKHHASRGDGFGVAHGAAGLSRFWHSIAQRMLHPGNEVFRSQEYRDTRDWCRAQGRSLNMDNLRHVFTIRLLNQRAAAARTICVVGDGQANFVGPMLYRPRAGQRLVSINLPEVLISDHAALMASGVVRESEVVVAKDRDRLLSALQDSEVRLVLVPANRADIVSCAGIDLFVNIASFQEMTPKLVKGYFDIAKSNRALLYCCNRVEKVLYGGERLLFDEYPWGSAERLLWEPCPWHQRFYAKRPPFVRPYDGPFMHALVRFVT